MVVWVLVREVAWECTVQTTAVMPLHPPAKRRACCAVAAENATSRERGASLEKQLAEARHRKRLGSKEVLRLQEQLQLLGGND